MNTKKLRTKILNLANEWQLYHDVRYSPEIQFSDLIDFTIEKTELQEDMLRLVMNSTQITNPASMIEEVEQFERRFSKFKDKVVLELITHGVK